MTFWFAPDRGSSRMPDCVRQIGHRPCEVEKAGWNRHTSIARQANCKRSCDGRAMSGMGMALTQCAGNASTATGRGMVVAAMAPCFAASLARGKAEEITLSKDSVDG
jgi:hypothetical protein